MYFLSKKNHIEQSSLIIWAMFCSRTKIPPREAPLMYASGRQGQNQEAWGGCSMFPLP